MPFSQISPPAPSPSPTESIRLIYISVSLFIILISLYMAVSAAAARSLQSCPTPCNLIDSSPPGSPIPGILQARTLEWVAIGSL